MKRQGGFTLIELVVVIVILGILAVTAAPRFLNLQGDAREASLEGLRGAVASAMGISYGRAAINGIEATTYTAFTNAANPGTVVGGIAHHFGYPTAVSDTTANQGGIVQALDLSQDFVVLQSSSGTNTDQTNTTIDLGLAGFNTRCVRYTAATNATTPATVALIDGAAGTACGLPTP
ncbi:type II secretion system protein [Vibrio tubiashii]|uniref:type II secretion system protein n=1 Tax=Vibrio oreintalis group TaxID=1891919 RepID=UPI00233FF09C|nr:MULTISPECIES: type II secretion system protein [Vibrio oreintalis group]MDC5847638.1 type II secretion system GspH family protein [Vibrio europaeus]WCP66765.1 type II secretion system protein [Vibrio tubiashii]